MPRIVQCPKCCSILREPPPGNPFYKCGSCSTTLQAKHATPADLEASKRRLSADQQSRNSFSDSPAGEISERVADEFAVLGKLNNSPSYKRSEVSGPSMTRAGRKSFTEQVPDQGGLYVRNAWTPPNHPPQDRILAPYGKSLQALELDMKQLAVDTIPGADFRQRRATTQEIGGIEQWPPSPEPAVHGASAFRVQQTNHPVEISSYSSNKSRSVGREYEMDSNRLQQQPRNGTIGVGGMHQAQTPHGQLSSDSLQGQNHHHNLGGNRSYETHANNIPKAPMDAGNMMTSEAPRSKLRWQTRDPDSADEVCPPGSPLKGISENDRSSEEEDLKLSVSVKETTSVEYMVDRKRERNWRTLGSRRQSFEDRRPMDEGNVGHHLVRTGSEDSEKAYDMYDNPAYVADYEPSESSSTVDEAETNQGNHAGPPCDEMVQFSPPLDQGIARSMSRRSNIPRSSTSSGRSVFSEESNSPSEFDSPDNHLDNARMTAVARRHSWDERATRMASAATNSGPQPVTTSRRPKSSSQDFGSRPEHFRRGPSDPGWNYRSDQLQMNQSQYDLPSPRQQPSGLRPSQQNYQQQQQWINRYAPSSHSAQLGHSPSHQQWSPNASSRSLSVEPSPLHPLQSRPSFPLHPRPILGQGQLPPKQGHYPMLPPPGALPRVSCHHCGILLAVPVNLPPPKTSTQKLRCGSCRKICIFSVPQAEECDSDPVWQSKRADPQTGQSLLATSPDSQADFTPSFTPPTKSSGVVSQRSVRRYSVSDVSEKQVQVVLPRKHSLDLVDTDQEIVERALMGTEELSIDPYSTSIRSSTSNISARSDITVVSNDSDVPSTNSPAEEKTRLSGNGSMSPGSRYQKSVLAGLGQADVEAQGGVHHGLPGAGRNLAAEDQLSQEISLTSSDSECDLTQQTISAAGSPQLNHSNSRSPPPHPNSPTLQDSTHATGHAQFEQNVEAPKGLNKTLKGIFGIKKSVLELAKSKHGGTGGFKRKVVVNGVHIPDHQVKKAEEQAGPIHPGSYWYDVRAGFWGAAGGQCLGIIPPFIEELNYPMSKDCSGGRSRIWVNGRELHNVDRDKLSRRGLPETPGISYRIEIDGRVIDEISGTELKGLGKLAPSVEQKGCGTGMYSF